MTRGTVATTLMSKTYEEVPLPHASIVLLVVFASHLFGGFAQLS